MFVGKVRPTLGFSSANRNRSCPRKIYLRL